MRMKPTLKKECIRAVIIDDEEPARRELRTLLKEHPHVEICGEAPDARRASLLLKEFKPDLLFLDIEMPGCGGLEWSKSLPLPRPQIIFTTAYSEFAVEAFELHALDYLMKPINPPRLKRALERYEQTTMPIPTRANDAAESANITLEQQEENPISLDQGIHEGQLAETASVFVRDGDRCWYVPIAKIPLLEAEGNYTRLHLEDGHPLVPRTLSAMESRLPEAVFMRANRSQIINLRYIETINQWFSGSLKVRLHCGVEVEFSRRQAQVFRERMSL
jgi:two-component system LytT family response regulator